MKFKHEFFGKMAEGAANAIKYGLAGVAVGTATGVATDFFFRQIGNVVQWSGEGNTAKMVVHSILAGTVSSVMLYGGSMLLETVADVSNDPLYLIVYYNTALMSQNTIRQAVSGMRHLLPNPISLGPPQSSQHAPPVLGPEKPHAGPVMGPQKPHLPPQMGPQRPHLPPQMGPEKPHIPVMGPQVPPNHASAPVGPGHFGAMRKTACGSLPCGKR